MNQMLETPKGEYSKMDVTTEFLNQVKKSVIWLPSDAKFDVLYKLRRFR